MDPGSQNPTPHAELAYIERRRSRVLEDINGTRPLVEIVEQITELVSFRLKGAPCWCQIADGAQLGNYPPKVRAFRVVKQDIPARVGPALGTISVALDPLTKPQAIETEALVMATALSALAIETRRLYSDLRRRSEFDLLTDTHNRFSLDKRMDALIAEARITAGVFGFIYIDLDQFKQINDRYGHHVGDLYLQEVAIRMKRQLRSHDLLARQGGDEFAVLVSGGAQPRGTWKRLRCAWSAAWTTLSQWTVTPFTARPAWESRFIPRTGTTRKHC